MNPIVGVFFHWLGGLASGSFYVPFRGVKKWSWEVYWLAAGIFSWILAPWIAGFFFTNSLIPVLWEALTTQPKVVFMGFVFGMMWGAGGLTFGLTMRYLGMSLGMAVALGYTAAFGTLMPPIFKGEFFTTVLGTESGVVILLGVGVCMLGIVIAALAGTSKEREMSEEAKKAVIKEFSFVKGLLVATFSGVMSAGMSYGMSATLPIAEISVLKGTPVIWSELPRLCIILLGGFTTNFIWCMFLFRKNKTGDQFFAKKMDDAGNVIKEDEAAMAGNAAEDRKFRVPMIANYVFCAMAGITWYLQFFFYSLGETQMGLFNFASWPLHMASIMIFSSLWGLALGEWKGSSGYTKTVLAVTLTTLIFSTIIIGYGTNIGKAAKERDIAHATQNVEQQKDVLTALAMTGTDSPEFDTHLTLFLAEARKIAAYDKESKTPKITGYADDLKLVNKMLVDPKKVEELKDYLAEPEKNIKLLPVSKVEEIATTNLAKEIAQLADEIEAAPKAEVVSKVVRLSDAARKLADMVQKNTLSDLSEKSPEAGEADEEQQAEQETR